MTMFTQFGRTARRAGPRALARHTAQRCLDIVAQPRPEREGALVHHEVLAPPDLERILGSRTGSIFQGEQGLDQMAFMRPSPCSRSTRRRCTGSTCAARARTPAAV